MKALRIGSSGMLAVVALSLYGTVSAALLESTTFEFQGHITHNGLPVTGICNFRGSLWDSESGGTKVAQVQVNAIEVIGGLFKLPLDFTGTPFSGPDRWLQLETLCTGDSGFLAIGPREFIAPVPYAIHTRGIDVAENGDVQLEGNLALPGIELFSATPYIDFHFGNDPSDNNVRIINQQDGVLSLEAPILSVGGFAFFGDKVGIGTATPQAKLDVAGIVRADAFYGTGAEFYSATPVIDFHWNNDPDDWNVRIANSADGLLSVDAPRLEISGDVGIGTSAPNARLDVGGAVAINGNVIIDAQGRWVGPVSMPDCGNALFPRCANQRVLLCGSSNQTYNGPFSLTPQQEDEACAELCTCGAVSALSDIDNCSAITPSGVDCLGLNSAPTRTPECGPPGCVGAACNYGKRMAVCCVCKG